LVAILSVTLIEKYYAKTALRGTTISFY